MFTQSIPAVTIAMIVFLIVLIIAVFVLGYIVVKIREALGIDGAAFFYFLIIILIVSPLLLLYVYDPIRRRLMIRSYISWLKTFDDEYAQPQNRLTRIRQFIRMQARRLWIQRERVTRARGVTQVSISLLPRYQGDRQDENSRTEFPGDVFLE